MSLIVILVIIVVIWIIKNNRKKSNYRGYRDGYHYGSKGLSLPNDIQILSIDGYTEIHGNSKSYTKGFKYGFLEGQSSINK